MDRRLLRAVVVVVGVLLRLGSRLEARRVRGLYSSSRFNGGALGGGGRVMVDEQLREDMLWCFV